MASYYEPELRIGAATRAHLRELLYSIP